MVSRSTAKRIAQVAGVVAFVFFIIISKLAYVQLVQGQQLQSQATDNRLRDITVKPKRGVIYDRNDSALAISISTESVYVVPSQVRASKRADEIASILAETLDLEKDKVLKKFEKNVAFEWVKRQVDDETVQALREMSLPGVGFIEETKREYPKGILGAHILGFAGIDNQGLNGLELKYDDVLMGVPGRIMIEYDAGGREIPHAMEKYIPPTDGYNLHLTLDETIQYIVERELDKVMKEQNAAGATAIVMDVRTGGVLAMANRPTFDPNDYGAVDSSVWNNFAVSGVYEPGSTFKILTASMALEEGATTPEDRYYCPGYKMIGKIKVKCWKHPQGHGSQSFTQGVMNSCNPVFIEASARLGQEKFYKYMEGFGMKEKTGIDLPGETVGITVPQSRATALDLATMSMGQANAFTPIQMITAISAVANGGWLMEPHVVAEITDNQGNVVSKHDNTPIKQVISKETAEEMRVILEQVVSDGTGKKAKVEGYTVGGKTGTAQKPKEGGGYSATDYIPSFVAFAPTDDPQIAVLVLVDSPRQSHMGGVTCGPVVQAILKDTLRYLNVPMQVDGIETKEEEKVVVPDVKSMTVEKATKRLKDDGFAVVVETEGAEVVTQLPPAGSKVAKGTTVYLYGHDKDSTTVVIPDLTGKTIKEADKLIADLGLQMVPQGSGVVVLQDPPPKTTVEKGASIRVQFASPNQPEVEDASAEPY